MAQIEDLGISFVHGQVAKMGFFFREQPKHDFGIDAHIETADANGKGSGRNIAVQIKSGLSYIRENEQGDIVHYTDEQHIRYWAGHSLPVILIVFHPEREIAWWCDVKAYIHHNPSLLSQGPYKIVLPATQQFTVASSSSLIELAQTSSEISDSFRRTSKQIDHSQLSQEKNQQELLDILQQLSMLIAPPNSRITFESTSLEDLPPQFGAIHTNRREVVETINALLTEYNWVGITGQTGSGKTGLAAIVHASGHYQGRWISFLGYERSEARDHLHKQLMLWSTAMLPEAQSVILVNNLSLDNLIAAIVSKVQMTCPPTMYQSE